MPGNIKQAATDVSRAASWAARVGGQVSELIKDYRTQGEVAVSVDVGPFPALLKFRIELPEEGKP